MTVPWIKASSPDFYREKAEDARRKADMAPDENFRRQWREIAESFEILAKLMRRRQEMLPD